MFLFCKPIIFSVNCRICRDLAFGSVKTRFKAILKMLDFSAQIDFSVQIDFFMNFCPWRATKLRSLSCRSLKIPWIYMFIDIRFTFRFHLHFKFTFTLHLHYIYIILFHICLQNVIWLNTRTGLRYKRHILHAPKYDE